MSRIFIDTQSTEYPRFGEQPSFFFRDYEADGPMVYRMLCLQKLADKTRNTLTRLSWSHTTQAEALALMEELWQEAEMLPQRGGATVETKQSDSGIEVATSSPSPSTSTSGTSRSSTKRKRTP